MKAEEEKVLAEALRLPSQARAAIATRLLDSLDDDAAEDPADVEAAWAEEIERRKAELASGSARTMTREEALRYIASDDPDEP